jgi:hypothetical protein
MEKLEEDVKEHEQPEQQVETIYHDEQNPKQDELVKHLEEVQQQTLKDKEDNSFNATKQIEKDKEEITRLKQSLSSNTSLSSNGNISASITQIKELCRKMSFEAESIFKVVRNYEGDNEENYLRMRNEFPSFVSKYPIVSVFMVQQKWFTRELFEMWLYKYKTTKQTNNEDFCKLQATYASRLYVLKTGDKKKQNEIWTQVYSMLIDEYENVKTDEDEARKELYEEYKKFTEENTEEIANFCLKNREEISTFANN